MTENDFNHMDVEYHRDKVVIKNQALRGVITEDRVIVAIASIEGRPDVYDYSVFNEEIVNNRIMVSSTLQPLYKDVIKRLCKIKNVEMIEYEVTHHA